MDYGCRREEHSAVDVCGGGHRRGCTVYSGRECLRVKSKNIIGAGLIKEERPVAKTCEWASGDV